MEGPSGVLFAFLVIIPACFYLYFVYLVYFYFRRLRSLSPTAHSRLKGPLGGSSSAAASHFHSTILGSSHLSASDPLLASVTINSSAGVLSSEEARRAKRRSLVWESTFFVLVAASSAGRAIEWTLILIYGPYQWGMLFPMVAQACSVGFISGSLILVFYWAEQYADFSLAFGPTSNNVLTGGPGNQGSQAGLLGLGLSLDSPSLDAPTSNHPNSMNFNAPLNTTTSHTMSNTSSSTQGIHRIQGWIGTMALRARSLYAIYLAASLFVFGASMLSLYLATHIHASSASAASDGDNLVYLVGQSLIVFYSVVAAVVFVVTGRKLVGLVHQYSGWLTASRRKQLRAIDFTATAAACAEVTRAILLILSFFFLDSNATELAVIVLSFAMYLVCEIAPTLMICSVFP
jgi:hypothetical protein